MSFDCSLFKWAASISWNCLNLSKKLFQELTRNHKSQVISLQGEIEIQVRKYFGPWIMRLKPPSIWNLFRTVILNIFTYHLLESCLNKSSSFLVSKISNHPVSDRLQTKLFCKTNRKQEHLFKGSVASTQTSCNYRSTTHTGSTTMICRTSQLNLRREWEFQNLIQSGYQIDRYHMWVIKSLLLLSLIFFLIFCWHDLFSDEKIEATVHVDEDKFPAGWRLLSDHTFLCPRWNCSSQSWGSTRKPCGSSSL